MVFVVIVLHQKDLMKSVFYSIWIWYNNNILCDWTSWIKKQKQETSDLKKKILVLKRSLNAIHFFLFYRITHLQKPLHKVVSVYSKRQDTYILNIPSMQIQYVLAGLGVASPSSPHISRVHRDI